MGVFDNTEILDVMPGVMATSLIYAQHRAVAKGVGFLAQRPPVLVSRLLRKMVPCFANVRIKLFSGGGWYSTLFVFGTVRPTPLPVSASYSYARREAPSALKHIFYIHICICPNHIHICPVAAKRKKERNALNMICVYVASTLNNRSQSGDVLYLEHEVGGHWYILRAGTISFYVSVSPLETQSEVLLMRTLSEDGNFGLTPVILNVLNRWEEAGKGSQYRTRTRCFES